MADHDPSAEHPGDGSPVSVGGVVSIVGRVVSSMAKELGYPQVEEIIKNGPEKLGEKLAGPFRRFAKKPDGTPAEPRSSEELAQDEKVVADALQENPREAAMLLGQILGLALEGGLDADDERTAILKSYAAVLGMVSTVAMQLKTSLALRGFLNGSDFISYWHYKAQSAKPTWEMDDGALRPGYGIEIYFFFDEPTEERLQELNTQIRRLPKRQLNDDAIDVYKNDNVAKLTHVYELSVQYQRLNPDRKPAAPFGNSPISYTSTIQDGAPGLPAMIESLFAALASQGHHRRELAGTLAAVDLLGKPGKG